MQLIRTNRASKEQLDDFLLENIDIDREHLITDGYIVSVNHRIIGCFILDELKEDLYWLRQLYIMKEEAMTLPVVIEAILNLAKDKAGTQVIVNSHQLTLDIILKALHFYPHNQQDIDFEMISAKGKWWVYHLNY